MEPENVIIIQDNDTAAMANLTSVCVKVGHVSSQGIFFRENPLHFSLPLLLLQTSLASGIVVLIHTLIKPLGLPLIVAQVLGGIILGPTLICRNEKIGSLIFPVRGSLPMDVISAFGFMYYFFLVGVQTDLWMIKKINKKTFTIGFFTVVVPMILSPAWAFFIIRHVSLEDQLIPSLFAVAQLESVLSFPMVAYFLTELKIINTEFGKLALYSSIVSNLFSSVLITTVLLANDSSSDVYSGAKTLVYSSGLVVVIFLICRPLLVWMTMQNQVGQTLKQSHTIVLLLAVAIAGFCSEALGLRFYFGPLVLGLMVPAGPPIGSTLVEKLHILTYWFFLPLFFAKTGLVIDMFGVSVKRYLIVQFIVLMAAAGKLLGAFVSAVFFQIPPRDAVSLGLALNAQGIIEIGLFRVMKKEMVIDNQTFAVMCISLMIVTGTISLIVQYLNDPSRRYKVYNKRTVMHTRPNSEMKLLVCIDDHENVPSAINLIEALNPCKQSPLAVYVLHLVELVGRATPILIRHRMSKNSKRQVDSSLEHTINAFRYLEESQNGLVTVFNNTAISPIKTMHDEPCTMALEERVSLLIIPFHKRFYANGATQSSKQAIKVTNKKILDMAPCSVAILVDRGPLKSSRPIWATWSSYNVALIFLGGPDDREALAIGARMAGLSNIRLTVIRLIFNGNITGNDVENALDNELLNDFRKNIAGNGQALYIEELVMDGTGTIAVLRSMEDYYELVMVGRHHDKRSPLLSGLTEWNENKELGTIGDMLACASFLGNATILVVQQHTDGVTNSNLSHLESLNPSVVDEELEIPLHRKTWQSSRSESLT